MKDDSKQSLRDKLERRATLNEGVGPEAKAVGAEVIDQNNKHHHELQNTNKNKIVDRTVECQKNESNTEHHKESIPASCDLDIKSCRCIEPAEQFKRIKRDIQSLKSRLEVREGEEIVLVCNNGTCLKGKVQLRNNLERADAKTKDLEN